MTVSIIDDFAEIAARLNALSDTSKQLLSQRDLEARVNVQIIVRNVPRSFWLAWVEANKHSEIMARKMITAVDVR